MKRMLCLLGQALAIVPPAACLAVGSAQARVPLFLDLRGRGLAGIMTAIEASAWRRRPRTRHRAERIGIADNTPSE